MTVSPTVEVQSGDQVACHIQGQQAAERFVASLTRYFCSGFELTELLALANIMPAEKRAPWLRGFGGALQKALQQALDAKP